MPRCRVVSPREGRLCNTMSMVVDGAESITLLANLDLEGICASSGSACAAGSLEPSHVIRALNLPNVSASSLIRFSVGRDTTSEEIRYVTSSLPEIIRRSTNTE